MICAVHLRRKIVERPDLNFIRQVVDEFLFHKDTELPTRVIAGRYFDPDRLKTPPIPETLRYRFPYARSSRSQIRYPYATVEVVQSFSVRKINYLLSIEQKER